MPTFWTRADCNEDGRRFNADSEDVFLQSILVSRTFENTCAVVFANAGGPVDQGEWCGLSQVAVPFVGSLGRLGREEGMSVVELDMRVLEVAEENYKVRADMGREGWHYSYSLTRGESGV